MEFHKFLNQLPVRRTDSVTRWLRKNPFKIKSTESSSSDLTDRSIILDTPEDLPENVTCWEDLYRKNILDNDSDDIVFQCRLNQRVQLNRVYEVDWSFYNSNKCQHVVFTKFCPKHKKENRPMELCKIRKLCPLCQGKTFIFSLRFTIPLKTRNGTEILVALKSSKFPNYQSQRIFERVKIKQMFENEASSSEIYTAWLEEVKEFVRETLTSKKLKIFSAKLIRKKNDSNKKRAFLFSNDFEIL